jgi:cephalosporin hydroxylase
MSPLDTAPPAAIEDDRAEFEVRRQELAAGMAADPELRALARELLVASDRHDWSYQWTWLGVPIIQMPPDIVVLQEIIWRCRPDLIIETGVARGGSLVFEASMLQLLGHGRVLGIDIDIRPHNRASIEDHPLAHRIDLLQGSSIDDGLLAQVHAAAGRAERVMVILDSNHTHEHVLAELRAYAPLVTEGQFLVVADTMVEVVPPQQHRPRPWGPGDNPMTALDAFLAETDTFVEDEFVNAKVLVTASPRGYLRRTRPA